MDIRQIADRLNEKAVTENFQIAALPELRKKYLHKKQLPAKIFTWQTIKDGKDKYAFHNGGRDEIQFNVGEEDRNEKFVTRFALCFSLEPSHSLLNPVEDLEKFRERFNLCIESHSDFFADFTMWYYQNEKWHGNYRSQRIPDEWFQLGNFICIGNIIEKPLTELNEIDLSKILSGFDNLLPIYQFCVLQSPSIFSKEKRIAKVCWNGNDWVYPSGVYGKSSDVKSHERERGYGLEEWLFDFEKLVDGYHYALLQSAQNGKDTFLNKCFDVRLFSHNSNTKENLWIGSIKNLEVISNDDAKEIHKHYQEEGWLDEMSHHIKSIKGDFSHFMSLNPHECFNVRFKPEYAVLDKPYKKVEDFNNTIGTYHYQFVRNKEQIPSEIKQRDKKRNFKFEPSNSEKDLACRVSLRQEKIVQSEPLHDNMQQILYDHLKAIHKEENVGMETDTGLRTRIDVSLNTKDGIILYEIKSYPSVMMTIRVALGQLLEYAYYPNPIENIKEMIIVSHIPIEHEDKEYLEFIRKTTSLNIFYQSIDVDKKVISEKA